MKKFKLAVPISAFVLAIAASAFAFAPKAEKALNDHRWFVYSGSGSINDPANYDLYNGDGTQAPSCTTGSVRCAVLAIPDDSDPSQPDQSDLQTLAPSEIKNKN